MCGMKTKKVLVTAFARIMLVFRVTMARHPAKLAAFASTRSRTTVKEALDASLPLRGSIGEIGKR